MNTAAREAHIESAYVALAHWNRLENACLTKYGRDDETTRLYARKRESVQRLLRLLDAEASA